MAAGGPVSVGIEGGVSREPDPEPSASPGHLGPGLFLSGSHHAGPMAQSVASVSAPHPSPPKMGTS